jgi:hypothetical protein
MNTDDTRQSNSEKQYAGRDRKAMLVFSPTTGHYSLYQSGTNIVLKDFLSSREACDRWCKANGWFLPPAETLSEAVRDLIKAIDVAMNESVNRSGYSDDSEPVLRYETREILSAAVKRAKELINPKTSKVAV